LSVDQAQFFVFLDLNCVAKEPKGSDAPNLMQNRIFLDG
jgi:hypothetical protein